MSSYQALPCPEFRKGMCRRGDACPFAHGVFECWLHPSRYRTTLCKEGASCTRAVCFFAHSVSQLREAVVPIVVASPTCTPSTTAPLAPIATSRFAKTLSDSSLSPSSPGSTLQQGLLGSFCTSSAGTSRCASPGAIAAAAAESLRQNSLLRASLNGSSGGFTYTGLSGLSSASSFSTSSVGGGGASSSSYSCSPALSDNLDNLLLPSEDEAVAVAAAVAARAHQQQAAAAAQAQSVLNRLLQTASMQGGAIPAGASLSAAFSTSPSFIPPVSIAEREFRDVDCDVATLQQLMSQMGF